MPSDISQQVIPLVGAIAAHTLSSRSVAPELLQATVERDQVLSAGAQAKPLIVAQLRQLGDTKATKAWADLEEDPEDEDYRSKLVKELTRLAQAHPDFARELGRIAESLPGAGAQAGGVNIANYASNQGFQGNSYAPITIDNRKRSE